MKKILTIPFIFFLCCTWSFAQDCTIGATIGSTCVYDGGETGTVMVPAGVTSITIEAWGAGGGSDGAGNKRPGGGGGAYFTSTYAVTSASTVVITQVGVGMPFADGTPTTFTAPNGAPISVNGGLAPTAANSPGVGGAGAGAGFTPGGNGGARAGGGGDGGGGGGGSGSGATDGISGANGGTTGGAGGSPGGGDGGDLNNSGSPATGPGGGAGGNGNSNPDNTDLPGGNGQVIVTVTAVTPLPVELVSFNANAKDKRILLEWQTASELNNQGFEIQKSKDGRAWDMIEFVEGKGTASAFNTYASIDEFPAQGSNYYRLKQLDFDGKFKYSETVIVDFNRLNEVELFPNPAKDELTLINGEGEAILYNTLGQAVKQLTIDANQATIQLDDLLNGQYYLQVLKENGTIVTKQFAKVN